MLRPYKGTLRDDPPLVARVLLVRSHPQRRGLARRVRLRPAVPRPLPLDPAARGKSAAAGAWLDHVALSGVASASRSEEHTSELQSRFDLVCRLLLEKKKK